MHNQLPLVSVGVASFNNCNYLRETLESIRLQTYKNIELLIVDDASSDESVKIAEEWLAEYPEVNGRLVVHSNNMGVCRVCNDLITQTTGEFICLIGSDDIYLPDKLAIQVPLLLSTPPEVGVIFSAVEAIGPKGEAISTPPEWSNVSEGQVFLALLKQNFVLAMGTLIRRACFEKVGLYDENLSYEDLDMWLRIARDFEFKYVNEVSAKYRIHPKSAMQSRKAILTESTLVLLNKQWGYSEAADNIIRAHIKFLAERLYIMGSPQAEKWLQVRWSNDRELASWILYRLSSFGIPGKWVARVQRFVGR